MKNLLIDWCQAFRFLTRLPMGSREWIRRLSASRQISNCAWVFPLVGLSVAGFSYGIYQCFIFFLPAQIAVILMITAMIAVTGAFHEDGLADCADGLGGKTVAERLVIMKDHRIGTYGGIALILSLILRIQLLLTIPAHLLLAVLVAEQMFSRTWMVAALRLGWWAKSTGLAVSFGQPKLWVVLVAFAISVAGLFIVWEWPIAAIIITGCGVFFCLFIGAAKRVFGGITGDVVGALQQLLQLVILFLIMIGQRFVN